MAQFLVCVMLFQLGIIAIVSAHPSFANFAQVKRSVQELNEYYDYIIIGGGTAGLTVANRLTEDSSSTSMSFASPIIIIRVDLNLKFCRKCLSRRIWILWRRTLHLDATN